MLNQKRTLINPAIIDNNPVANVFRKYAQELDAKHDRYERIIKLSRDITIESKRIIFLLHTYVPGKENNQCILDEAKNRLNNLCKINFNKIAKELRNVDPYKFIKAYSAGLQEFIEAFTFYEYTANANNFDSLNWNKLQEFLTYKQDSSNEDLKNKKKECDSSEIIFGNDDDGDDNETLDTTAATYYYKCIIEPKEFMLGIGDLSGEIMRRCVNSLATNDIKVCFETCIIMKNLYSGFLGLHIMVHNKEINYKVQTLRQSLAKVEEVCYNIKIRGQEGITFFSSHDFSGNQNYKFQDEGYSKD